MSEDNVNVFETPCIVKEATEDFDEFMRMTTNRPFESSVSHVACIALA